MPDIVQGGPKILLFIFKKFFHFTDQSGQETKSFKFNLKLIKSVSFLHLDVLSKKKKKTVEKKLSALNDNVGPGSGSNHTLRYSSREQVSAVFNRARVKVIRGDRCSFRGCYTSNRETWNQVLAVQVDRPLGISRRFNQISVARSCEALTLLSGILFAKKLNFVRHRDEVPVDQTVYITLAQK